MVQVEFPSHAPTGPSCNVGYHNWELQECATASVSSLHDVPEKLNINMQIKGSTYFVNEQSLEIYVAFRAQS